MIPDNFFRRIVLTARRGLSLRETTDYASTADTIERSLEFRGENIWVLFFAIIIASVGLNVNSTAVIIGAMLVSPLMGPICGIGFSIGINDSHLLRKSLYNLVVMVLISLVASSAYFLISPLSDARSELLARTSPTIFDVLIAFSGGMAGIIATSRRQQSFAVISGVAIATALMPPLCTAGYGIASLNLHYFLGAFYLFFINSFFIALATFLAVSYVLHFPKKKYIDPRRASLVKRWITVFSILAMVPSVILAFGVVKESSFHSQAIRYLNEISDYPMFERSLIVKSEHLYSHKSSPRIVLTLLGPSLSPDDEATLRNALSHYNLQHVSLVLHTANASPTQADEILSSTYNLIHLHERQLREKDSLIAHLTTQHPSHIPATLPDELRAAFPDVQSIEVAEVSRLPIASPDTSARGLSVYVHWSSQPTAERRASLHDWLRIRLSTSEVHFLDASIYR